MHADAHRCTPMHTDARLAPVDEDVASVFDDLLHFVLHLLLLGQLEFGHFGNAVDANPGSEHFDLVGIHRSVCDENCRRMEGGEGMIRDGGEG